MTRYQLTPESVPLLIELAVPIERSEAVQRVARERGTPAPRLDEIFEALLTSGILKAESTLSAQSSAMSFAFGKLTDHRAMLADTSRLRGFRAAIERLVRSGDTVVDVGSGSGILSFFAARAGAKTVYGLESERIVEDARQLAADNGLARQVTFVEGDAARFSSPVPADVVMGEWIGLFLFDEWRHFEAFAKVRDSSLRKGGVVIPQRVHMFLVPVEDSRLYLDAGLGFWEVPLYGLDFRLGRARALEHPRMSLRAVHRNSFLGEPQEILDLDCATSDVHAYFFEKSWKTPCVRDAMCHGFAGYFLLDLAPGIRLDTSPFALQTHWHQSYFPMEAFFVRAGDQLMTHVKTTPDEGTGAPSLTLSLELERGEEILHRAACTYPVGDPRVV